MRVPSESHPNRRYALCNIFQASYCIDDETHASHSEPMGKHRPSSLKEVFGMNVRLERVRARLSQEELAARIGTDQSFLSQVERGVIAASLDTVEKLSNALGVRSADLLDESLGRTR